MSTKRGQTGVITTVILILIGLAAIALVAVFIINQVKDNIESTKLFSQISDISIKDVAVSQDSNFAKVLISAGSNNLTVNSTEIVLSDEFGKTQVFSINDSIGILESKHIYIPLKISHNLSKVELYPVIYINGKRKIGNMVFSFSSKVIILSPGLKEPNGGYCLLNRQCNSSFCNSLGVCSDKSLNSNCGNNSDCNSGYCNSINHICSDGAVGNNCAFNFECSNNRCGSDNVCGGINSVCENIGTQDSCSVNLSCGVNHKCTDERCGDGTCNNGENHDSCDIDCPGLCDGTVCLGFPFCYNGQCCNFFDCVDPCENLNCNNGNCISGNCICSIGYTGVYCNEYDNAYWCNSHGTYDGNYCSCDTGYSSSDCSSYDNAYWCNSHGTYDGGSCSCDTGYGGNNCDSWIGYCGDSVCSSGYEDVYGCPSDCYSCGDSVCSSGYEDCSSCSSDCGNCPCSPACNWGQSCEGGSCVCSWWAPWCDNSCYGINCNNGYCAGGACDCNTGYTGVYCNEYDNTYWCNSHGTYDGNSCSCDTGYGGNNCDSWIGYCGDSVCDSGNGEDCNSCSDDCGGC